MLTQYNALITNGMWVLVTVDTSTNIIGCKWIFRTKFKADGSVERLKTQLVAKGFNQRPDINYQDTFGLVVKPATIVLIRHLIITQGWILRQIDINDAFLQGHLTASAETQKTGQLLSKIQLIYVAKTFHDLSLLHSISNLILNQPADGSLEFKVKVFLTQEEKGGSYLREILNEFSEERRLFFGTNKSSHTIHGPETPVYMATIAMFCSFIFILFLCIFNHFFLPVEGGKSSDKTTKRPSTLIDLLVLSAFLIALSWCALVATILRQRRLNKEEIWSNAEKQETQLSNAGLVTCIEQHEVHFVGRPNFQDELYRSGEELGAADLDVVVCGPESLKESVVSMSKML